MPVGTDAVFVAVPAQQCPQVLADLATREVGGAVVYASGFAETGSERGRRLQSDLLAAAGHLALIGPNCYGLINYLDGVALWPDEHGGRRPAAGRGVAIISQSSSLAISMSMVDNGLPLAYIATVGNSAALSAFALAEAMLVRAEVTAIGLLLESVSPTAELERLALAARESRVPIVAFVLGRSAQAARLGRSHSASLHTPSALASALLRRLGVGEVTGVEELLGALQLLHCHGPLPGRGMTSLSCSGGEAALIADAAAAGGLRFPALSPDQHRGLTLALGERVTLDNPLDYHTYVWGDEAAMTAAFTAMLSTPADLNLFFADLPDARRCDPSNWLPALAAFRAACRITRARGAVTAAMSANLSGEVAAELQAEGLPVLAPPSVLVAAVGAAADIDAAWALPPPAPLTRPRRSSGQPGQWPEDEAKALLQAHGLRVPSGGRCDGVTAALSRAEPWLSGRGHAVVKALGPPGLPGPAHKSDSGAVRICAGADEVSAVARDYLVRFGGVLVEEYVEQPVAELLVSVDADPVLGLVLTLAAGGELVELLGDTVHLLMPCSAEEIAAALRGLRWARLLAGYRGRPAADLEPVAQAAWRIAETARGLPGLSGLEVNPLLITAAGPVVADVLLVADRPNTSPSQLQERR